jgi:hypothetical protein
MFVNRSFLLFFQSAAPRVIVPAAMRGRIQQADEDSLLANFRRLDQQAQSLITSMSDRLAAG